MAAQQQLTLDWWTAAYANVDCYVSPFVIQEISQGDEVRVERRLHVVKDIPVLAVNDAIKHLAEQYVATIDLPDRAMLDAFHLATAAWYKMDYVLSWNCKHIVSGRVHKRLQALNQTLEIHTPILCTPQALMEV